jgi:ribosome-binding protein aMBF1 (putative translation factor)
MSGLRNGEGLVFNRARLAEAIDARFITTKELAHEMEVPERTIKRWRAGTQPRRKNVRRLAEVLNVEPMWFYGVGEEQEETAA